ncbi:hypothetical protein [Acinetobacter baumannii]|uniref:hypothetical protein n=1 Tax=Acinetobacter baumannii TaxID=470 RepID=UPI0007D84E37|nr:hypothetical protein [Acinetobacter baumannii]MDM8395534.1 hypothetical protein [Acinetobacter baumannii]OAM08433.1 hypothetical protein AZK46_14000 [Acinetobacter baumannii]OIG35728.1 hypothetical protein A7N09_06090 [Acinetobacter baumannii]
MSLKCPFCQSAEIVVIEMNQQSSTALAQVVSPATLGALGATVAKSFNLPPLVGGVAGTVIGGLINAVTDQPTRSQQSLFYCQNCTQRFPSSLLH